MAHKSKPYVLDHSESSTRSHRNRTVANSAAYLLTYVKPDMRILDVGCGPGTITVDFAAMVPNGDVTGIETGQDILNQAQALADERRLGNVIFEEGDILRLKYADNTFDLCHAHQVSLVCRRSLACIMLVTGKKCAQNLTMLG